jgi:hypothetical protein
MSDGSSSEQTETFVINWARMMSSINRRTFHNVDDQGNAQLYHVGMKVYGNCLVHSTVAPNTYYTRKAIKAWSDARFEMFERAGISKNELGAYGKTLRPYLNVNHENATHTELDTESSAGLFLLPNFQGAEWTYSKAATSTPMEEKSSTALQATDLVDMYTWTLLDSSVTEPTSGTGTGYDDSSPATDQDSYVSVGMIESWLDSIKKRAIPGSDSRVDADNPLLQLVADSAASEEILELADDAQAEARPWDIDSSQYSSGVTGHYCVAVNGESSTDEALVPCGLMRLDFVSNAAAQDVRIVFDVVPLGDMTAN